MTDWRTAMRDAAQRDEQDSLSADQADAMRRVVLAAVADDASARRQAVWVRRPALVAAAIVAIVSIGVGTGVRLDVSSRSQQPGKSVPASELSAFQQSDGARDSTPNRQLQFLTPGGTRIIWVFNQDLDLKATVR